MLDRSRSRDRSKTGGAFSPVGLFVTGAQGAWYDPSDFSTLYQTSTGTTPVTAVEQPVGLMLDRSRGLVLGAELAPAVASISGTVDNAGGSSGTFSAGVWSATCGSDTGYPRLRLTVPGIVVGRSYQVTFSATLSGTITSLRVRLATGGSANDIGTLTSSGTVTGIAVAATTDFIEFPPLTTASASFTVTVTALSVRELPGTHATQATSASRPVLRARYNLLTYSEQFDDAYWSKTRTSISANAAVAPDGTTTADKLIENTDTNTHTLFPNSALTLATTTGYTYSIYAKAAERTIIHLSTNDLVGAFFDLSAGTVSDIAAGFTASITSAGSGWYRCVLTQALNSNASGRLVVRLVSTGTTTSYTGDGVSGVLIWGAQLQTAADQTSTGGAYQRIAAATDYDTSNPVWRPYLAFDGTDDSFSTSSIDFSGTDKVTVFAGVTKLSDATQGMLLETSTNVVDGGISFFVPSADTTPGYRFTTRGTATSNAIVSAGYAAPVTNTLTGISDISGDVATLRANGTQVATSTSDQGTGNFGNYPLYIGRRAGSSLPFNGRLYSLAVLGRTATAAELASMEAWVNR
jgi:hypothetical protein